MEKVPESCYTFFIHRNFPKLQFATPQPWTPPLFCIKCKIYQGRRRECEQTGRFETNRVLDFFKYWTVGGVIWLGDPALAAGIAEWHGLTSCLWRGWLQAEERRDGQKRTRANKTLHEKHTKHNQDEPAATHPTPRMKYVKAIWFYFTQVNNSALSIPTGLGERTCFKLNGNKLLQC